MSSRPTERRSWEGPALAAIAFVVLALVATALWDASGKQVVDIELYRRYGEQMGDGLVPYRDFRVEYPPWALPAFLLPALLTAGEDAYTWAFAALMAVCGGLAVLLVAGALRRSRRSARAERRILAVVALSPLVLGAVLLTRFDLLPAALTAAATLLVLAGRVRLGAGVLGAAVAVKLYPAVLLPLLAAWAWRRFGRREAQVVVGIALAVVLLAYLPFLLLAPEGVYWGLERQLGRPLQIESLGAGVLLVLHQAGMPLDWESSHGSQNLTGAAAGALAVFLSVAQVAALAWIWVRFARGPADPLRLLRYGAAALAAMVALGKVLSPQFLIWLLLALPLVAGRRGRDAAVLYALACALTTIWFPASYWELVKEFDPLSSFLVLARDIALVGVLLVLARPRPDPLPVDRWQPAT